MDESVRIVAIASITNVLGYLAPIPEICRLAHEVGAVVVCDGAQSVPHRPTDVKAMGVDFLAFSAHKLCGPTGLGVLYGRFELLEAMEPIAYGGGSNARYDACGTIQLKNTPERFESGTPPIEAVLGLGAAITYLQDIGMANIAAHDAELMQYAGTQLAHLDTIELYNPDTDCGLLTFNVKGIFPQDTGMFLNSLNIAVRTGNHCSKLMQDVIGINESVRASLYFYNTKAEVDRLVQALKDITLEKCIDLYL